MFFILVLRSLWIKFSLEEKSKVMLLFLRGAVAADRFSASCLSSDSSVVRMWIRTMVLLLFLVSLHQGV